ncbi:MAG: hypothetical protein PUE13_09265 [Clostridiales bacterium]|nr:hypothetical protein [Clostridiales bacterium]
MKKIVLVLCTVMALCSAGSALAVTVTPDNTVNGSRNSNTELVTNENSTNVMPCFRAGDTLEFNISATGKTLTIISYKLNSEIGNRTVQYIDQRDITATGDTISYKIRDIDDGIYLIALNDESGTIAKLYYKVGTPKFNVIKGKDGSKDTEYFIKEQHTDAQGNTVYSLGFAAKATIGSGVVSFSDAGVETFGFKFYEREGKGEKELTSVNLDKGKFANLQKEITDIVKAGNNEIAGAYTIHYFDTIYNVPETVYANIRAEATMTDVTTSTQESAVTEE